MIHAVEPEGRRRDLFLAISKATMNYGEAIDWLYRTQLIGIKLGLENVKRLLAVRLANPAPGVKVVHVAGTNGKGSTCAMIDAIARASGMRCGLFTSPHLVDFCERMRVGGEMPTREFVADELTTIREAVKDWENHPTFFEITLVLAMRYFRERSVEMIVLETGMGGRLDATNAIPKDVAVIMPVAMDHAEWLGDTLTKVAGEKAGIIQDGVPVVSAPQEPEALTVIEQEANAKRSVLTVIDEPLEGYGIGLAGAHQRWNAAAAVQALHAMGLRLRVDVIRFGLENVVWPGRFERRQVRVADRMVELVMDATHNPHAAESLAATWDSVFGSERKAVVVMGAADKKDVDGVLDHIERIGAEWILVPINSPRSMAPEALAEKLRGRGAGDADAVEDVEGGLQAALQRGADNGMPVLVTGSLFLLGEVTGLLDGGEGPRKSSQ
ncbi:bifunctional folylpolyglutamate synthase/dihydrofolate synthase [Sulfuriroseicoccus oceanibius]|uniref:Dihydrofolate synthase/folylpolyglutamate synthase n=1 Tax=Sulfuriroseicoccus oceanibius TaxID=2707525 RepID=A0A6B3LDI9_9BACT|nr:folylpolyglutamate synthase/dihydrofolate synthase family protein [Sulfuriroseicoccus oceanibius]QQL45753.1 bifunctional folylpolyglutamate synthase/dihydrofolate synthase [Sulfuriroseicoccus oceanibius]